MVCFSGRLSVLSIAEASARLNVVIYNMADATNLPFVAKNVSYSIIIVLI